jgi:DNA-binding transcriptional ArsR family regulator
VLARQLWGTRVAIEVKVESGDRLRGEIARIGTALKSIALGQIFLLMMKGANSPSGLTRQTGKSKYAVSVQLAALKRAGLVKVAQVVGSDMRLKRYEVVWAKIGEIFRQDHALELEIYENQMSVADLSEIQGNVTQVGLAISGNGKLGLVREVTPHDARSIHLKEVNGQMNALIWEFAEFFKGYVKERRYNTIREYLLGAYEELSEHYGRLPKESELGRFFEFSDRAFARITPIEQIWSKYIPKKETRHPILYRESRRKEVVIKLFAEAGSADPSGRYILNAETQAVIKPGTPLRIYPAFTYP